MSKFNVGDKVVIHWKLDIKDFVQDGVITAIHAGEYGVIVKTEDSGVYAFNRDGWFIDEKSSYIEKIEPKTQFKVGDNDETDAEFLEFLHNELDYGGCSSREYDYLAGYLARANGEQSSIITNFKEKFDKQNSPEYKEYLRLKAIYD